MFIGFHLPIVVRQTRANYLWTFFRQMTYFAPEDIVFICGDDYLDTYPPDRWDYRQDIQAALDYVVPSAERMKQYDVFRIDPEIFREIDNGHTAAWKHLIQHRFEPLERELAKIFSQIVRERNVEAVLTWCNTPSLEYAAAAHGVPVIYNELGALRSPNYISTAYFDFSGVNGNTECERRYAAFRSDPTSRSFPFLTREELLAVARVTPQLPGEGERATFAAGVAEQLDLDSNTVAFSDGWSRQKLLSFVIERFGKENVLTRRHPLQPHDQDDQQEVPNDESPSSIEFLAKCDQIFTINSSVGLEAMLYGKETTILGQNPFRFIARMASDAEEERRMALNFAMFGYLVPYQLIYDHRYLRWRLSGPSEAAIMQYHCGYWLTHQSHRLVESLGELARLKARLTSQQAQLTSQQAQLTSQQAQLTSQQAEWDKQRLELEAACRHWSESYRAVIASTSWRLTAPARWLGSFMRRRTSRAKADGGRYPQRDATYYQDKHDHNPAYDANNWLLEQFDLIAQLPGANIAEFGCGNGRFLERAASHFPRVHGFDWARSRHIQSVLQKHPNVCFEMRDVVRDFPKITADIVASADFLEHLMPDDVKRVVPLLDRCAPINFHVIACYDDTHSHQTVLPPSSWLELFRRACSDYYVLCDWCRDGDATKRVCIMTNYPPPGVDRDAFIARAGKTGQSCLSTDKKQEQLPPVF
jgi:2-polyprenyl-3-methyl-5-hydroxy-6-metoxy-1,4-benzoquinol methylase